MRDPYQLVDGIDEMKIGVREDFAKIIELYKNPIGIVVGGGRGLFVEHLLENTMENLFLYVVKAPPSEGVNQKLEEMRTRLLRFPKKSSIIIGSNVDAASKFEDGFFDFIYLDNGSAYEIVKEGLETWWPKAKNGAMISGQGYAGKKKNKFTAEAVNDFIKERKQELFFTYEEKKDDKERLRSFYFFKNMAP